jgi:DNA recombination protein RmuC
MGTFSFLAGQDPLLVVGIASALAAILIGGAIALIAVLTMRARRRREDAAAAALEAEQAAAERMAELQRLQAETAGKVRAMGQMLHAQHAELQRAVHMRLDSVTQQLGQSMHHSTRQTTDNLQKLNERLAVIDAAQQNITQLATQVTSLQNVLTNKQQRGAFGQGRMEMIIQDGLAKGTYAFQHTLSNRTRPDCAIFFPDQRPLIVDAKFPLEAVTALRDACSDEERHAAGKLLRQAVSRHISDIAEKYLLPGETQDLALMFVPSESVYAELHDQFDDMIQRAFRSQVVIVSPSLLMLAIQVIQQIHRDARMREAADKIHAEVGNLMEDLRRLRERVAKLDAHFGQASEDIRQILVSAEKVEKRGARIREVEFDGEIEDSVVIPAPFPARRVEAGE